METPIQDAPKVEYIYTLDQIIKQLEISGINLGDDPIKRINTFVEYGLLPQPKQGKYPSWVIQRIIAIQDNLMEGKSLQDLKDEVSKERRRFLNQVTDLNSMIHLYKKFSNNSMFFLASLLLLGIVSFGFLASGLTGTKNPVVIASETLVRAATDAGKNVAKTAAKPVGNTLVTIIKTSKPEDSKSADPLQLTNLEVEQPVIPDNLAQFDDDGNLDVSGNLDVVGLVSADGFVGSVNWSSLENRPNVLSAIDDIENDGGNIDLVTGSGITITPDLEANTITIGNVNGGSDQFIFKNIAVSGQSTIITDQNNDTLNLAAGANVSLTTNATTDTLTIGVTGTIANADTLDSLDSLQFLRSDTSDSLTSGTLTIAGGTILSVLGTFSCTDCVGDGAVVDTLTITAGGSVASAAVTGSLADSQIVDTLTASNYLPLAGGTMSGNIDFGNNLATNIGVAGTDFTASGGLTLADVLTVTSGGLNITGNSTITGTLGSVTTLTAATVNTTTQLQTGGTTRVDSSGNLLNIGDITPAASPTGQTVSTTNTLVDNPANNVGWGNSLTIGSDGLPIISYFDSTAGNYKVAKCNDLACTGGDETITTFDPLGMGLLFGQFSSIAIGTDGLPVIAYYDDNNGGRLRVAKCNDIACSGADETITIVDDPSNRVGRNASIAIGKDSYPVVAYHDFSASALKVAKCNDTDCTGGDETITSISGGSSGYISVAIGTDGNPVISHYQGSDRLHVTKCNDPACSGDDETTTAVDDPANNVGLYTSIVIGTDGYPVIAYYDSTADSLKVAKCNDTACTGGDETITTVDDPANNVGLNTSIALAPDGYPVVSYMDTTDDDVKIAKCNDDACTGGDETITQISDANSVAVGTSIAIGNDGLPVVSHGDNTAAALKVTHCATITCSGGSQVFTSGSNLGSAGAYWWNVYASRFWGQSFQIAAFDLAEEYPTQDSTLTTGDLVSISSTVVSGKPLVERSTKEYDSANIGIVSTEPGITLGEWSGEEKTVKVALAGRVPVKISTENGSIAPGDPLTSSSTPGVAMKATKSGPTVGKALEGFACQESGLKCQGKIMVFVSTGWYVAPLEDEDKLLADLSGITQLDVKTLVATKLIANIIETDELILSSETSGNASVQTGESSVEIEIDRIKSGSKILVTFETDYSPASRYWVEKEVGKGFMVKLDKPVSAEATFSWLVIN